LPFLAQINRQFYQIQNYYNLL